MQTETGLQLLQSPSAHSFPSICQPLQGELIAGSTSVSLGLPAPLASPGKLPVIRAPSHQLQCNISIPGPFESWRADLTGASSEWPTAGSGTISSSLGPPDLAHFQSGSTVILVLTMTILAKWAETRAYTPPEEPTTGAVISATDTARDPGRKNKGFWQLPAR